MYGWLWRHLPGGRIAKVAQAAVLLLGALALLFLVVFPWAATHVPFLEVTVDPPPGGATPSASTSAQPPG